MHKMMFVVLALSCTTAAADWEVDVDPEAREILKRMSEFISGASEYTLVADMGHEVRQPSGQMLEFGSSIKASLQQPSKARVRFDNRDGDNATIVLDGSIISVFSTRDEAEVYDTASQPGAIDTSFVFLAEQLQTPDQLHHFFSIDLTDLMKAMVTEGYYVGVATINGVLCDNLALRNENEDVQLWVEKGETPFPRRIAVRYKELEDTPQFWANFTKWDFSPDLADEAFAYTPPKHADRALIFSGDSVSDN